MNEGNSFIVDIDNWFSNDPRLNEYLKTHDSISVRKELIDNGERRQGVFTFYKDRRDCMYTLTIEDYEPLAIEFGEKRMTDDNKLLKSITDYLYEQNVRSDCGIESLASDLIEIAAKPFYEQYIDVINKPEKYFPRTDYDRMCFFLKEIGCKFTKQETMGSGNILTIEIDSESIISFGGVAIDFYDDGSFEGFEVSE